MYISIHIISYSKSIASCFPSDCRVCGVCFVSSCQNVVSWFGELLADVQARSMFSVLYFILFLILFFWGRLLVIIQGSIVLGKCKRSPLLQVRDVVLAQKTGHFSWWRSRAVGLQFGKKLLL